MNNSFEGITLDNRFELIAEIGSGGMGRVFKARQIGLERLVAIKILDPVLNFDPEILSRFEREARSISVLKHAHIAAFYHYGMHLDSMPYIAMEFLNGASLRQEISEDGIDWPRTLRIARQICDAMAYAHQNGVIHRDLKPNNIILLSEPEADWVKILDFGLAKIASLTESGKQKLTKTGELIGSVNYLSPEQCLGRKTDGRSDIYSLSCVIFEMLTGQTPFDSDNPLGQIHKHVNEIAPLVSEVQKTRIIPPGLDLVVQKGLAKLPEDRYQTMEELSSDLQKVHEGKIDELLANSEKKAAKSKPNKLRLPLGIAVGAVLLLLVAAYIYVLNFTGAGLIYQIQSDLSKDNSERKRMTWLTKADKAEEAGKKESAGLIITELSRTVSVNENNTFSLARLYLAHAKECLKAGNRKAAGKWAMKSLTKMLEYERPEAKESPMPQRTIDYLKMLEDSSTVALVTPDKISKQDAKKIDHIARPMIDVKGTAIISLAELYDRAFQDNHIPPTEALADTLTFAVKLLASQGNDKSFQRLFPRAERATIEAYEGGVDSPYMPALYFGAASDLAKKNPELARHYLDKGKLQYGKRTDRENNKTLEDAATYLITAYERLGEYSNAIAAAKDFVETTRILPESRSSAQAHGFLAHAYFMDRQFKPALEEAIHACKIYRQLKSNEVANLYYPELVDLTHTIKVIRLLKQSSYEALLKEGYRELSLGKKFYEQENEPGTASDVAGLIAQLSAKQKD